MTVQPPSLDRLRSVATSFGMTLDDDALATMLRLVTGALTSYDVVDALAERDRPVAPERAFRTPDASENPLNGWYVTCEVTGSGAGPLAGRRVAVKDNVMVAGLPMMNGSRSLEGFVPVEDATVVTRVLAAGATVAGKAVCEDLCFSGGSHTSANGPVRNPWDPTRSSGGSSSGSAVLVATGAVDLALGGDQGGSVRMPASWCGIVGLKATHGLVPYTGGFPIEATLDHLGPMARTVADTAALLTVLAGPDGLDPRQAGAPSGVDYSAGLADGVRGKRIGVLREGFGLPGLSEPEVDAAVRRAAQRFNELGAEVVEVSVPEHHDAVHVWNVIATEGATWQMVRGNGYGYGYEGRYSPELMEHYGRGVRARADELSPTVQLTALCGQYTLDEHHGTHYAKAQNLAFGLRAAYDAALADVDVLVLPTHPMRATVIPAADAPVDEQVVRALEMIGNTAPFDVTGHPAISVPAEVEDGLPVGMMVVGRRWDEAAVLRTAHAYEQLVGGFPRPAGGRLSGPVDVRTVPPLDDLVARASALAGQGRRLLGLAGAPGAGKSTLAAALVRALGERAVLVPMDGFHLDDAVLDALGLRGRKGAPETFDAAGYVHLLGRLRAAEDAVTYAPVFRREQEQAVAGALPVPREVPLVVTEGNYLLAGGGFAPVRGLLDACWFVDVDPVLRRERLVARHVLHGRSPDAAERWVAASDDRNAALVDATRDRADLVVRLG